MARPKLRRLERQRMRRADEQLLVLRDPLELCEPFAIDAIYEPVLDALDGQRTLAQVRQSLLMRGLATVELDDLEDFVGELHELGLLDDDRFRELWAAAHAAFVAQEIREPRRAGLLYPEDPEALRAWLAPVLPSQPSTTPSSPHAAAEAPSSRAWTDPPIAIVAPHQPPPSCGPALRRLLSILPEPEHYERVVVLATDHSPGLLPYAACDKDIATPLGTIPADLATLAALDERLPWLLREQVRLRTCDPLEWSALLLRALWGDRCPPIVALACGQTRLTTADGLDHARELVASLRELLLESTSAGKVLWWTCAELSHLGPAYGHAELPEPAEIERDDRAMLEPLLRNQPEALAAALMSRAPTRRPSGSAALVTLAELLPEGYRAVWMDYALLPTPGDAPGWIGCPFLRVQPR
ncbi:MAG: AmmeMemoRadiSam system protein B [Enhygromyxa sp.]